MEPEVCKMTTFVCKDCGQEVSRLTEDPANDYAKDICLTCLWIRENKNLTEEEKDILRGKFGKIKTHGP